MEVCNRRHRTDLLHIDTVRRAAEDQACLHCFGESLGLRADLFLLLLGEVDKVIVFGANKEWYCSLVEASTLTVPFLDRVECALSREVEHEENCDSIVADQREHVDEFTLSTKIPD